jgi:hypothetical protein
MNTSFYAVVDPLVKLFMALIASGVATSYATELLKLRIVPIPAQRYPRITNAVVSLIATFISLYVGHVNFIFTSWIEIVAFALGVYVLSAITYHHVVAGTLPAEATMPAAK